MIFALFGAIAMVGVLGAGTMHLLRGPVRAMSEITKRTIAENNMMAAGKLAIIAANIRNGDCDSDGTVEPIEWADPAGKPAPGNGGLLPITIGASMQDPWGNIYGYCDWDHGTYVQTSSCGMTPKRLRGNVTRSNIVLAVLSAGPDKTYQTICNNEGGGEYVVKQPGSDDVVLTYTYAEAKVMASGLWDLKDSDPNTAEIAKNLSVKDTSGVEQLSFDATSRNFALGTGGTGSFPTVKADFLQNISPSSGGIEFLSNIKMNSMWLSGDGDNEGLKISSGGDVTTSGKFNAGGIVDASNYKIIRLATPTNDTDAATKAYVDAAVAGSVPHIKCESFVFTTCTGGGAISLAKTNLGACKKACEAAGVQCCQAEFTSLPGNPNVQLDSCDGYNAPSQTSGGIRNLLTILLGGGKNVSALCYLE